MNLNHYCPQCKNEDVIEFDASIRCRKCNLDFDKEFLGVIPDGEILSHQELGGLLGAFTDEERMRLSENEL